MKVKRTLHQIYQELVELREARATSAQLIAMGITEGKTDNVDHFSRQYKKYDDIINYLSHIEVEYEDKYETEEDED